MKKVKVNQLNYFLEKDSWGRFWMHTEEKNYEISVMPIYPQAPIESFLDALMAVMKGRSETSFNLYYEPDSWNFGERGHKITIQEISAKKELVNFQVAEFMEEPVPDIKMLAIEFEIKKIQLIRMLYFEFKKMAELMKDKAYDETYAPYTLFENFPEFEKMALEYMGIA